MISKTMKIMKITMKTLNKELKRIFPKNIKTEMIYTGISLGSQFKSFPISKILFQKAQS